MKNNRNIFSTVNMKTIQMISDKLSIEGSSYTGNYEFQNGHSVPIYTIETIHALNQIIGYAKFINRSYGDVYYRGERRLHQSLTPSLDRMTKRSQEPAGRLNNLIRKIADDIHMKKELKLSDYDEKTQKEIIEGLLQHYGISTRYVDVVDNHWIALWMGHYIVEKYKRHITYYHYKKRVIPVADLIIDHDKLIRTLSHLKQDTVSIFSNDMKIHEKLSERQDVDLYQYILLIAIPGNSERKNTGIFVSDDYIEIDLRQALPSIFLRPHAQHGWVVRKKPHNGDGYDMSETVIGILKIRIDIVEQWLGTGELLTQENLFPPMAYDNGYDLLLKRQDLFEEFKEYDGMQIINYI